MNKQTLYEQPANELIRVCLRIEQCFKLCLFYLTEPAPSDSQIALATIIELMGILDRPDLKSKLTQEFQRHTETLNQLKQNPNIDKAKLETILSEIHLALHSIQACDGKFALSLRENKFLEHVRSQMQIGIAGIDSNAYYGWIAQDAEQRIGQLNQWFEAFKEIEQAIHLLLRLIRESAPRTQQVAKNGYFEMSLESQQARYQLIRINIAQHLGLYPEVSVGKHRLCVRFLEVSSAEKGSQTSQQVDFDLSCCGL